MPLAPRLTQQSAVQLVLAIHLGLLFLIGSLQTRAWCNRDNWQWCTAFVVFSGAVFIAQIGLIACWAAFSHQPIAVRLGTMVLFVPFLALVQSQVYQEGRHCGWWLAPSYFSPERHMIWVMELTTYSFLIWIPCSGLRVARFGLNARGAEPPERNLTWSFRLSDLIGLATLAAICLGVVKWLGEHAWTVAGIQDVFSWGHSRRRPAFEFAACALTILIGVFRWPLRWTAATATVFVLFLTVANTWWLKGWLPDDVGRSLPWYFYLEAYGLFVLIFSATLLVFRDRGCRLSRS